MDAIYSDIASRTVTVAKAWHDRRDTIKEAVQKRRDAFEEFARAVCGAPHRWKASS